MEGVILYADNHIKTEGSGENKLYNSLSSDYPVLGVNSLDLAKSALNSMSGFKAIILDWDFNDEKGGDELDVSDELGEEVRIAKPAVKENQTLQFLRKNEFYTLIYVFSGLDVKSFFPEDLKQKFGDRIQFVLKGDLGDIKKMHDQIINDITTWEKNHSRLSVPIKWSNSINQSLQKIFNELAVADINWIVNLYETASTDGVNPEIEVINLLQNLLAESLITRVDLIDTIKTTVAESKKEIQVLKDGKSIAILFQRIYYTDLRSLPINEVPVMTGDIFLIDADTKTYGIIVSPECDIQDICTDDLYFEMLTFRESHFSKQVFIDLFGQKNNKVSIDNKRVIETIQQVAKEKFTKFSASGKPPVLYSKIKNKIVSTDESGQTVYKKEESFEQIQDDVLIKPFLNQLEALVNKHISPALRITVNEQIQEQNDSLLNELFQQAYNQTEKRIHLIPSFNFDTNTANKTAVIDFRSGKAFKTFKEIKETGLPRICKLNHPFIAELRQRYLSYYGRVGVPKIPTVLREYNLASFQTDAEGS